MVQEALVVHVNGHIETVLAARVLFLCADCEFFSLILIIPDRIGLEQEYWQLKLTSHLIARTTSRNILVTEEH
jgi:hypothetical protein